MGRWAQQRRRGGGPPPWAYPTRIVSVQKLTVDTARITFAAVVAGAAGVVSTNVFNIGGNDTINVLAVGGNTNDVQMESNINVGDTWNITGLPPWLFVQTPVAFPDSGLVV